MAKTVFKTAAFNHSAIPPLLMLADSLAHQVRLVFVVFLAHELDQLCV